MFVQAGAGVLRNPGPPAAKAAPVLAAVRSAAPVDPARGRSFSCASTPVSRWWPAPRCAPGRLPRLAALVLIGSILPTTAGGHRFWEFEAGPERNSQRNHLLKNLSIAGGLLHVATAPRPARRRKDRP